MFLFQDPRRLGSEGEGSNFDVNITHTVHDAKWIERGWLVMTTRKMVSVYAAAKKNVLLHLLSAYKGAGTSQCGPEESQMFLDASLIYGLKLRALPALLAGVLATPPPRSIPGTSASASFLLELERLIVVPWQLNSS